MTIRVVQADSSEHSDAVKFDVVDQVRIDTTYQDSIDFELTLPQLAVAGFVGHDSRAEWFLDASLDVPGRDPSADRQPITVLSSPIEPHSVDDAHVAVERAQRAASKAGRRYRLAPTFIGIAFLCVGIVPLVGFLRDSSASAGAWTIAVVAMSTFWIALGLLLLRAAYRKVGPSVSIDIDKPHLTMGETLRATVSLDDAGDDDFVVRLQGVERFAIDKEQKRGIVVTYGEHVFHDEQRSIAPGRTDVSFVMPHHRLGSYAGTATTIEWRLVVVPTGDEVREFTPPEHIAVLAVQPRNM